MPREFSERDIIGRQTGAYFQRLSIAVDFKIGKPNSEGIADSENRRATKIVRHSKHGAGASSPDDQIVRAIGNPDLRGNRDNSGTELENTGSRLDSAPDLRFVPAFAGAVPRAA